MVVIIDYGMGNIYSIQSALRYLGVEAVLSSDHDEIRRGDHIILPGVGSFRTAMENLTSKGMDQLLRQIAQEGQTPLLGICLGMQLMGRSSTEDGFTQGLGLIDYPIERFPETPGHKVPHVGFNYVKQSEENILFQGLPKEVDVYYTHSYRMTLSSREYVSGTCNYIEEFVSSFRKNKVFGTQFHPEKSQANGLIMLKNFIEFA